jgi:hypothetical protein
MDIQAQEAIKRRKGEFIGLVKIGAVASQIYNDDFGGYNKLGGTAGFGVYTNVFRSGGLQLEINYAMRGSRKPPRPDDGDFTSALIEAHYVDIPILYRSQIWKLDYEFGLCTGVLITTREVYNPVQPPLWDFNRIEMGINAGIHVPITDLWSFNPRFHYSITPAAGKLGVVNTFNLIGGAYHNAISFSLVRMFRPN